jgi:NADPH:quinone reductase-like Zn-dependent oxidoreductase
VGIAAVQIAKAYGATVIGAASSEDKRKWVLDHGADQVVDYTAEGWTGKVKELSGGKGVNAVIDGVGGKPFEQVFDAIARGANICVFGASGGREVTLNITNLYRTAAHIHGSNGTGCTREDFLKMLDLFGQGKLKPTVEQTLPLAHAADAHRAIEERKVIGKIVLKVQ